MELNERQLALYRYMTEKMQKTPYISKFILMIDLDNYYHRSEELNAMVNSTAYRTLRKDIETINKSTAQYVILPHKEKGKLIGYKLATKNEEIAEQAERLQHQAIRLWIKARELHKKAMNNGQIRMTGNGEKEIRSTVR